MTFYHAWELFPGGNRLPFPEDMKQPKIHDRIDLMLHNYCSDEEIVESRRKNIRLVMNLFKSRFGRPAAKERVWLVSVPNRVELLGKHTDYQGGRTLLLTGPKNFFAVCCAARDGLTEIVNADPELGETVLRINGGRPVMDKEGAGSHYTFRVAERLSRNLMESGLGVPPDVKAVFYGDIPIGGGTSGSSAKVICDFLIFTAVGDMLSLDPFRSIIIQNGIKAGLDSGDGTDAFLLALSMYIAHYENGLDFGDLSGDGGVGTFGGSEDHTAIVLGRREETIFCRYCPTRVLKRLPAQPGHTVITAYSGKKSEKTKESMPLYNRLSLNAAEAVARLREMREEDGRYLRDFYPDTPAGRRAGRAYEDLMNTGNAEAAGRVFQFYSEEYVVERAVERLEDNDVPAFGELVNESHALSRDYLKNIAPPVDWLQKTALKIGAFGATGFGGGFGGSCYAVVEKGTERNFIKEWKRTYARKYPDLTRYACFDPYPACGGCAWSEIDL